MASQLLNNDDGTWPATNKNTTLEYGGFGDLEYNSYGHNFDYGLRAEASPAQHLRDNPPQLTELETIEVFRNAVDVARELVHKQGENERIDAAVQPNLTLDLKRKGVESLPDEVIGLIKRDVERIVLSHNHISRLPARFQECSTMQYLNLRGNLFTEFPEPLLRMTKLQILDLSRNDIAHLPEEIRNMKSLRVLSVMHNGLSDLPLTLGSLDSLKILKMTGNPLNEQLKSIADGNESATSPLTTPIAENEKDSLLTIKIKQFLRNEVNAFESGGDSSGESPLETPRPLKRITSHRFPVVPAGISESTNDLRTPNLPKPPIPNRSHHRVVSGQSNSSHGGSFRRPSVSPLILGSERNRSNSENVLQGARNPRNKRMGMVPRKPGLSPLEESAANRNSLHLRGTSHGSILKDRHGPGKNQAGSNHPAGLEDYLQQPGIFIRQLSSVPEQRTAEGPVDRLIEGAKGLLFSLHALHPYISPLLSLAGDGTSKRSSLERVFYNSSTHLDSLDHELLLYSGIKGDDERQRERATHTIRRACKACLVAYAQVGRLLMKNSRQLLGRGDPRYIRMLLLLINGSNVEAINALNNFGVVGHTKSKYSLEKGGMASTREVVPRLTVRPMTPTQERPPTTRRLRSDTASTSRSNQATSQGHNKSTTHPQSAVPLYLNGRSRSNSRTNGFNASGTLSSANTPASGESFFIPGLAPSVSNPSAQNDFLDAAFENIYQSLQKLVEQALTALPTISSVFGRCLESAQSKYEGRIHLEMWGRLHARAQQTLDLCEQLSTKINTLKIHDTELRQSTDFWNQTTRFTNSFVNLCDEVKIATTTSRDQMTPLEISRLLKPVHKCVRAVLGNLRNSPWAFVLSGSVQDQGQVLWASNSYNLPFGAPRLNTHHRRQGDSGSSSSPYMPTTPLSAALGPAAQATMPTAVPTTGTSAFDRTFQGDVFQRAETFLTMQNPTTFQRRA